ncbi:hypothetical protein NC99_42960 [Sunxiuqinia dokdonensis]|uniref:Uncharacterized protein n=1 Tax=Sunxiuqinia dokdonensis TaxID=1409788 RepID=A0A0L8V3A9_9BACT|nr:hypothetical protein NC99_42960 [Sunxiuqinia dokdonensis]
MFYAAINFPLFLIFARMSQVPCLFVRLFRIIHNLPDKEL